MRIETRLSLIHVPHLPRALVDSPLPPSGDRSLAAGCIISEPPDQRSRHVYRQPGIAAAST